MYLCFGTLATLLNNSKQNIIQASFISKLISTIDPDSRYVKSPINDKHGKEFGDEQAISKLLSCNMNFTPSKDGLVKITSLNEIKDNFASKVSPFIDEYQKSHIICSLLEIIRNDNTIDNENQYLFKNIFGTNKEMFLIQTEYDFCDLMSKLLLYTTNSKINNKLGKKSVKSLKEEWIKTACSYYLDKFEWDDSTQCLTFSLLNYFNKMIRSYKIDVFIEKIDPIGCIEFLWIEKCDTFIKTVSHSLATYASTFDSSNKSNINKILKFVDVLDEYTNYIGQNVVPLCKNDEEIETIDMDKFYQQLILYEKEHPNKNEELCIYEFMERENFDVLPSYPKSKYDSSPKIPDSSTKAKIINELKNVCYFVPRYRDENVKWELTFASETQKYRQQLISIYQSIYGAILPIYSRKST